MRAVNHMMGLTSKQSFRALRNDQKEIETPLGPLDWQELLEKRASRIVDYLKDFDPSNRSGWEQGFCWLKNSHRCLARV